MNWKTVYPFFHTTVCNPKCFKISSFSDSALYIWDPIFPPDTHATVRPKSDVLTSWGGLTYFSVPLQLMGLRRSSSLSFRASWERVSALSLQLCSISCSRAEKETRRKKKTPPTLRHSLYFCNLRAWWNISRALPDGAITTKALIVDI